MLKSLQLRTVHVSVCRFVLLSVLPRTLGTMSDKSVSESFVTRGCSIVHNDPPVGAFLLNPRLTDYTTKSTDSSRCENAKQHDMPRMTNKNSAIIKEAKTEDEMCHKFAKKHKILPEKLLNFVTECVKKYELWTDRDFMSMQSDVFSAYDGAQKTDVSRSITADESDVHVDTSIEENNQCARQGKFVKTLEKKVNEDLSLSSTKGPKIMKDSSLNVKLIFPFVENKNTKNICHKQVVVIKDFEKDALLNIGVHMERNSVKKGDRQAKEAIDDSIDGPLIYSVSEEVNEHISSDNEIVIDMQVLSSPDISIHVDISLIDLQNDKFQIKKMTMESLKEDKTSVNTRNDISKRRKHRRKHTKDKVIPDEESRSGDNPGIRSLPFYEAHNTCKYSKEKDEIYNIASLFTGKLL